MLYITYPNWIKPEFFGLPFIRWYGLMYIVAFGIAYYLLQYQLNESKIIPKEEKVLLSDMFFYAILGLVLFARIAFVLIYDKSHYFLKHPHRIIWPFDEQFQYVGIQGMSYHGGVFGASLGIIGYLKLKKVKVLPWADLIVTSIPFGYTFGRIGNFINAELYGRITASPIGILFPDAEKLPVSDPAVKTIADQLGINTIDKLFVDLPRHPSQLYEAFFEGIFLGTIMWFFLRKRNFCKFNGFMLSFFLMGHNFIRFVLEYFRMPDSDVGFIIGNKDAPIYKLESFLNISMGQILSFILFITGLVLFFVFRSNHIKNRGEVIRVKL